MVLRNVRLVQDRTSRQRLVAAQDEERRRLERNIHDGAQQQLVALAVKARLAGPARGARPRQDRGAPGTDRSRDAVGLEDLRDLARGIYPPLLADQGLVLRSGPSPEESSRCRGGRRRPRTRPADVQATAPFWPRSRPCRTSPNTQPPIGRSAWRERMELRGRGRRQLRSDRGRERVRARGMADWLAAWSLSTSARRPVVGPSWRVRCRYGQRIAADDGATDEGERRGRCGPTHEPRGAGCSPSASSDGSSASRPSDCISRSRSSRSSRTIRPKRSIGSTSSAPSSGSSRSASSRSCS